MSMQMHRLWLHALTFAITETILYILVSGDERWNAGFHTYTYDNTCLCSADQQRMATCLRMALMLWAWIWHGPFWESLLLIAGSSTWHRMRLDDECFVYPPLHQLCHVVALGRWGNVYIQLLRVADREYTDLKHKWKTMKNLFCLLSNCN